jgi:hypothetical protein
MPSCFLNRIAGGVLGVREFRGDVHLPVGVRGAHGIQPLAYAALTRVNLLSAADEAHDDGPVGMAVHVGDQEGGLGELEVWPVFAALHEVCRLRQVPGPLCFIEYRYVIHRRRGLVDEAGVAEVVNVLDEGFDRVGVACLLPFLAGELPPFLIVANQSGAENSDQRPPGRKIITSSMVMPSTICQVLGEYS